MIVNSRADRGTMNPSVCEAAPRSPLDDEDGTLRVVLHDPESRGEEHRLGTGPDIIRRQALSPRRIGLDPSHPTPPQIAEDLAKKERRQSPPPQGRSDQEAGDRPGLEV